MQPALMPECPLPPTAVRAVLLWTGLTAFTRLCLRRRIITRMDGRQSLFCASSFQRRDARTRWFRFHEVRHLSRPQDGTAT
jgi:hypothetical protein